LPNAFSEYGVLMPDSSLGFNVLPFKSPEKLVFLLETTLEWFRCFQGINTEKYKQTSVEALKTAVLNYHPVR